VNRSESKYRRHDFPIAKARSNSYGCTFARAVQSYLPLAEVPRRPSVSFAIGASISSAVEAFAVAMAVELAPVRVNVVAPGIVRTPIWDRLPEEQRETFFAARGAALPVGMLGEPQEVAEAYLCFMRSGYTTGQIVVVDEGMLLV
jgi:NAD(P)-dependent dehydrogenase (short-subunit alcohol dehydrogenase family)